MDNPGLPEGLWSHLDGRLWHATSRDGLRGIIADEEIRVAVGERYVGSFCRNQDGVSLFDLGPTSENLPSQFDNMCGWFGHQQGTRFAVWLEIDRASVLKTLVDAKAVRESWRLIMEERRAEGRTQEGGIMLIAGFEACHKGPIPLAAVVGVLLIYQHNRNLFRRLGRLSNDTIQQIDDFETTLPPIKDHPLARAILAAWRRDQAAPSEE